MKMLDSVRQAMHALPGSFINHNYEIFCPVCGRGGSFQYGSAYKAVKHWNDIQRRARLLKEGGAE